MDEKKSTKKNRWIWNVVLIIIFLLMPGIRGYQNWKPYAYVLFVFIPVAYLIYDIVRETKKNRQSS